MRRLSTKRYGGEGRRFSGACGIAGLAVLLVAAGGCQEGSGTGGGWFGSGGGGNSANQHNGEQIIASQRNDGVEPAPAQSQPTTGRFSRPAALLGDRTISWNEVGPALAEAAGGQVMEEVVLDIMLRRELETKHLVLSEDSVVAERNLLGQALVMTSGARPEDSETLISQIRKSRGLGETRFRALLERNAMLRAIVRDEAAGRTVSGPRTTAELAAALAVSEEDVHTAYMLKYGPRVRARLILVRTSTEAAAALARLGKSHSTLTVADLEPGKSEGFADVAADVSLDPSRTRGGLLDPLSTTDNKYPMGMREALDRLQPGEISQAIAVPWGQGTGFVILKLEERLAPPPETPTLAAASQELRSEVRMVRERALMDRVANRLLRAAGVTVLDRSLNWSWEQWRATETGKP